MKINMPKLISDHTNLADTLRQLAIGVFFTLSLNTNLYAQTPTEQLTDAAQSFLEHAAAEHLYNSQIQGRVEVEVNRLDPRLKMPACDQNLLVSLESPAHPIGRVTTRVRCNGSSPWTVFVPAQVKLYRDVVITSRPIARNNTLSANDLFLAERDVSTLGTHYLTDLHQAIGLKTTRPLQAEQIILSSQLALEDIIRKGDQVVITAQTSQINVRMPGEALSSGAIGEQINVRNLRSSRVIRARITGPGQVEVSL